MFESEIEHSFHERINHQLAFSTRNTSLFSFFSKESKMWTMFPTLFDLVSCGESGLWWRGGRRGAEPDVMRGCCAPQRKGNPRARRRCPRHVGLLDGHLEKEKKDKASSEGKARKLWSGLRLYAHHRHPRTPRGRVSFQDRPANGTMHLRPPIPVLRKIEAHQQWRILHLRLIHVAHNLL